MPSPPSRGLRVEPWGRLPDGRQVHRYVLRNAQDAEVVISDLGASLLSWHAPDAHGHFDEVLLGHADATAYVEQHFFMGGVVGRWANRIRDGRFRLDGVNYQLDCNDHGHHLHGGDVGFHRAVWQVALDGDGLLLRWRSPDGEGGYPGNLVVELRYVLLDDGTLSLDFRAWSDRPTPLNLTAHPYFNLGGRAGELADHLLRIDADVYLPVDAEMIPSAKLPVVGSPFDFRDPAFIGARLHANDPQLSLAAGFDHCYGLSEASGHVREVAQVRHALSGRRLRVSTDQPGLQFYTGQHLAGAPDRSGGEFAAYAGFCLEAQAFPDQINRTDAERCVLRPGSIYRQHTSYCLDTD
ncbi:MAG: aldose epimerase family protein [Rhodanobacter sp.]